jgi:hypothetical protein
MPCKRYGQGLVNYEDAKDKNAEQYEAIRKGGLENQE